MGERHLRIFGAYNLLFDLSLDVGGLPRSRLGRLYT